MPNKNKNNFAETRQGTRRADMSETGTNCKKSNMVPIAGPGLNSRRERAARKRSRYIFLFLLLTPLIHTTVFANSFSGYASSLNGVIKELGGLVIGIGGVIFALGWHADDAGERIRGLQIMLAGMLIISMGNLFAGGGDVTLSAVSDSISANVRKAGEVVIGMGGVIFALGWHSDNADQRIKGLQTMTAGGLAVALAAII